MKRVGIYKIPANDCLFQGHTLLLQDYTQNVGYKYSQP